MEVYDLHTMKREEGVCSPLSAALGTFDGVHAGHAQLITRAVEYAAAHAGEGVKSAVWTFSDSLPPGKPGMKPITGTKEKLELFASLGVDYAILEDFSRVRDYTPERFVREILIGQCRTVCAVCGFNFRFGQNGSGDCDTLTQLMSSAGRCIVLPPYYLDGRLVSSSAIRLLVENGDMEQAARFLGRPFSIEFPVVHGKELGRTIGIPTINQNFPDGHLIPARGIYACTVDIAGDPFLGVANIGVRPTVEGEGASVNCETHIIHYNGWLYGKSIKVSFHKRLRGEIRFSGIDALRAQIEHDIADTLDYFSDK